MPENTEPLVKLQEAGEAAILSYNVPDPTSYPGRFNISLIFNFVKDQQDIFLPKASSTTATFKPRLLMVPLARNTPVSPGTGYDDTSSNTGSVPIVHEPDVEVVTPMIGLSLPANVYGPVTGVTVVLNAEAVMSDGSMPSLKNLSFHVHAITSVSGVTQAIAHATRKSVDTAIGRELWEVSHRFNQAGRYRIFAEARLSGAKAGTASIKSIQKFIEITLNQPASSDDKTAPGLTLTLDRSTPYVADTRNRAPIVATLKVYEPDSTIASVKFFLDNGAAVNGQSAGSNTYTATLNAAGLGDHTIRAEAKNAANLTSTTTAVATLQAPNMAEQSQALVLIQCVQLSNFLGSYGAGRTIQTFSLLPGEKTKITLKTYSSDTTTLNEARSIMDGYDETSADDFQNSVQDEQSSRSTDQSAFAASMKVEASGNWGVASARVEGSLSTSSASANEQFGKNVANAVSKHTASKSARRQAQVNFTSGSTSTSGSESLIERTIENVNVSRTLNFVFRQLNQEFVSLLHLTDVRIAHAVSNPNAMNSEAAWTIREVTLAEMDGLINSVVKPQYAKAVRLAILTQLDAIRDWQGNVAPVTDEVRVRRPKRDANGDLVYEGSGPNASLVYEEEATTYLRFKPVEQIYTDVTGNRFAVPGVILKAMKNTLRSDGVIVEALLGQANALDSYSTSLQQASANQRLIDNQIKAKELERLDLAKSILEGLPNETAAEFFAKMYGLELPANSQS